MADIKAADIIAALGGAENIEEVEGCITRLRVEVEDGDLVDKAALQAAGAQAVVGGGTGWQVIVGTIADNLAQDIQDEL
ncbi:PTS sugar transporter [Curtobacterium sp. MCLR17_043]|uniref:PTS transporter subunit EIIB n=1 Tax=Curtobacterium TaxID=2034 RepID=UPI000D856D5C|nr:MULTISPECIES: PTS transporter subunit EIIB [Curtobacterium]MBB1196065.1 PTS sugar transporter [Curtobacterium flaccumfaciens]PYY43492.1 PTS sugar transporter [Curtobacterium sp. MCLR17_043]PYY54189.1 PTS sugar transporter [Curtobacterium sp. MCSS17_011]WIE83677.1 PTS transporter subunit EIIB [Curtobacterium sp. MCPF17_021]